MINGQNVGNQGGNVIMENPANIGMIIVPNQIS
jgi:hypothetical protein